MQLNTAASLGEQSEVIKTHQIVTSVLISPSPEPQKTLHLPSSLRTPESSDNPFKSVFPMNKIRVRDSTFNTSGAVESLITSHQTPINVVICPQAGRAFTLFIRGMSIFIGPHDPLRSTTAAESKQSARLCRLAQPKNLFHPAKPREPPLRLLT